MNAENKPLLLNINSKGVRLFLFCPLAVYIVSVLILARLGNIPFNEVAFFNFSAGPMPFAQLLCAILGILSAIIIIGLPGFAWALALKSKFKSFLYFFSTLFALSIITLTLSAVIFKLLTPYSVNRLNFLAIIFLLLLGGLFCAKKKGRGIVSIEKSFGRKEVLTALLAGIALFSLVLIPFTGKYFLERPDGDGYETYEMAESLKNHVLSYGDFEHIPENYEARKGFRTGVPCHIFINNQLHFFFITLMGQSPYSLNLLYPLFIVFIFFIVKAFIPAKNFPQRFSVFLCIILELFLYTVVTFFCYKRVSALASDAILDLLFMIFLLLEVYFLINKNSILFLTYALFCALTFITGPVFTIIALAGYWIVFNNKQERLFVRRVAGRYAVCIGVIAAVYLLIGLYSGSMPYWFANFKSEVLSRYSREDVFSSIFLHLKYFIFYSGGIPILGVLLIKKRDKAAYLLSLIVIAYSCVVLSPGYKHLHHFSPIALFPLILFMRFAASKKKHFYFLSVLAMGSISFLIVLSLPVNYRLYSLYRKMGAKTCVLFNSLEEIDYEIFTELSEENKLFMHEAYYYADITTQPEKQYCFYFSSKNKRPLPGAKLEASIEQCYFWAKRDENLEKDIRLITRLKKNDMFRALKERSEQ